MSETDSFIEEVTEEVRRDQLFKFIRKYGWIGITVIVLIIGGAAVNEWQKARARAAAEAFGDAIIAATQASDAAARLDALDKIPATGDKRAILAFLKAAEQTNNGDLAAARETLQKIADDGSVDEIYRQLASLKLVIVAAPDLAPDERLSRLQPLARPGAPFRLLAEEQMALAEVAKGDKAAAIKRLQDILADTEATRGLRQRASQLIVALGGKLAPA